MPLSEDVRHELAGVEPLKHCDRLAELSGLFHTAGSLHLLGHGEFSVHLDLAESAVARRAVGLVRSLGVEAEIRTYTRHAFERGTRYQLHLPGERRALEVLNEAGVLSSAHAPLEAPPKRVVGRSCCRRAYLRGALLGGGSVSGPRAAHLEIRTASRAGAELLAWVAAQEDVQLRVLDRGRHAIAYAKGAEPIADILALAGAGDAALAIDEHAVVAEARARARRPARSDGCRRPSVRSPSSVCGIRRSPYASWRQSAGRLPPKRLRSAGSASSSIWLSTICNACSFARSDASYFVRGGSALVRRWIQT